MSDESAVKKPSGEKVKVRLPKINWDTAKMETTYANVVNAASTREEVSVFFGTNKGWGGDDNEQKELSVELSDRIVLNPYAAKRLSLLLNEVLKEYEKRFGALPIDRVTQKG